MISRFLNNVFFGATIQQLGHPASGIIGWMGGGETSSGVAVNDENAYDYSPVFAATRFLSSQIGDFPVRLMKGWRDAKRRKGAGRILAVESPVYDLVYEAPNPLMTASGFRSSQIVHQVNAGNCYAEIERDGGGRPMNLWPIHPTRVVPERDGKSLTYWVQMNNGRIPLSPEDILHVPSPISCDGISGKGVIEHARETIGLGLLTERHAGNTFKNGAVPRTVLSHPRNMNKEARQNLREEWQQLYGGTQNAGKTAVLWEDMKLTTLSMSNTDAQFLETAKFNINQIARWYGVPPYVLQDMDRATWSNLEQLGRSLVQMTFMPYIIRWEEEMDRKLLSKEEREEGFYIYFDVDEWQRGDAQARAASNQIKFMNGVISQDEWRAEEDDDPLPNGWGQKFYVPANLQEVGKEPAPVDPVMPVSGGPASGEMPEAGYKLVIRANGDREYVRDDNGQFAETDGGGGDSGTDALSDDPVAEERHSEDADLRDEREVEDATREEERETEMQELEDNWSPSERVADKRDEEDSKIQEARDEDEAQAAMLERHEQEYESFKKSGDRTTEESDAFLNRQKEEHRAAFQDRYDAEDSELEKKREAEDEAAKESDRQKLRDRWSKQDERIRQKRAKEDERIRLKREKEDAKRMQARSHTRMNAKDRSPAVLPSALACFSTSMARLIRVEMNAARAAAKKPDRWFTWLDSFYERFEGQLVEAIEPSAKVLEAMEKPVDVKALCQSHCAKSKELLLAASDGEPGGFEQRVETLVAEWPERASIQGGSHE